MVRAASALIAAVLLAAAVILLIPAALSVDPHEPEGSALQVTGRPRPQPAPTFVVRSFWTILRNQPVGLAIGNARQGTGVDSTGRANFGYVSGWVRGSFNGCAWTAGRNLTRSTGPTDGTCERFNPSFSSFISRINCSGCKGGTAVRLAAPTHEFANYSPERGARDRIRTIGMGHCVEWRWITADSEMVMVKDRSYPNNRASWVFVSRSALPQRLPEGKQVSCLVRRR